VLKSNVKNVNAALTKDVVTRIPIVAEVVATKATKAETVKVDALKETTVDKTTAMAATGIVQNVRILILHSEPNVIAVVMPVAAVAAVEDLLNEMTEEVATKATKAETVKVDALKETTVDKTTAMAATGIVQNVRILILHSEPNVIAVVMPVAVAAVAAVEDLLNEMTEEVATKATKAETVKVDVLKETTVDKTTVTAGTGIVQNVEIIISHSEPNVIHVDFLEAAETTVVAAMTDVAETTDVVEMEKSTPITIGIVQNVKTQTLHSVKNATDAKHLAQVAAAAAAEEDLLGETTALVPLDGMMVEDLLDETTALKLPDAMMVEDLLDVMTVEVTKAEAPTDRTELLNGRQENLEPLENHVEMVLAMHITALQNLSAPLTEMEDLLNEKNALIAPDEMMTVQDLLHVKMVQDLLAEMVETEDPIIEGAKPWVRNIITLTP
jgi:hypothetical protein